MHRITLVPALRAMTGNAATGIASAMTASNVSILRINIGFLHQFSTRSTPLNILARHKAECSSCSTWQLGRPLSGNSLGWVRPGRPRPFHNHPLRIAQHNIAKQACSFHQEHHVPAAEGAAAPACRALPDTGALRYPRVFRVSLRQRVGSKSALRPTPACSFRRGFWRRTDTPRGWLGCAEAFVETFDQGQRL